MYGIYSSYILTVIFTGMSTFSTKGGLYERAQKRFAVADGKRLFTYNFYEKRKLETLVCFLCSIDIVSVPATTQPKK